MTQLKRQIIAVVAMASLFVTPVSSTLAATMTITGNGSQSNNEVELVNAKSTTVVQSNEAKVENNVSSSSTTGGNNANDNTGGEVLIRTGDASSDTKVTNLLNSNKATVDCCDEEDVDVLISGNGYNSDNEVEVKSGKHDATEIFQDNNAYVKNNVDSKAETGNNDTKRNTGGDVKIITGDAATTTEVSTTANVNEAKVGGSHGENGSLSAVIAGNGARSENEIELRLGHDISVVQDNSAKVKNYVDAYAKTGLNDANDNTGGEVAIITGHAYSDVVVDNLVNFNAADIDCGCLTDLEAKIGQNGSDSENEIKAELGGDLEVFQGGKGNGNKADLKNYVDGYSKTGLNDANFNTGYDGADPYIWTGDAWSATEVSNAGNVNVFGNWDDVEWPSFEWSFSL